MSTTTTKKLRSQEWFADPGYYGFARRAWLRSEGFTADVFQNKPVIGICNSWSELNNCNVHLRTVAEAVKRGVWVAGGFPLEFPTISLGEMFMRPTTMLYRNLMAMDVEESIRTNPLDGVVLLCGCDKTTPAQLRPLHRDGHGFHHDQPGRSARHDPARLRQRARAGFAPPRHGRDERPPHRRNRARRPAPVTHYDARGARKRHHRGHGDRRIHQCRHPPDRHRRTPGH